MVLYEIDNAVSVTVSIELFLANQPFGQPEFVDSCSVGHQGLSSLRMHSNIALIAVLNLAASQSNVLGLSGQDMLPC